MDHRSVEAVVAFGVLLLVLCCVVWLFCNVVSFIFNFLFPPPTQIKRGRGNNIRFPESAIGNIYAPPHRDIVAIDTEMVGAGYRGSINMVARVSIVNQHYRTYDRYVAPSQPVTDYRTFVSGIRPGDLEDAESFNSVQRQVKSIIEDCILVGHDIQKDLQALGLNHPDKYIRDTALYRPFRRVPHEKPSLRYLAKEFLGRIIQNGEHSSVVDAQAALDLYLSVANDWEWALFGN